MILPPPANPVSSGHLHALSLRSPSVDLEKIINSKLKKKAEDYFLKKLEADICGYVAKLTEDSNEIMPYRISAFNRLQTVIEHCFPSVGPKAKLFGSCASGLALKSSDVDIAISGFDIVEGSEIIAILQLILEKLQYFKWVKSVKPIYTATIPVLKLEIQPFIDFSELNMEHDDYIIQDILDNEENAEGVKLLVSNPEDIIIRVDLSVENDGGYNFQTHLGYQSTEFVQSMLATYPKLYALTMMFKQFLQKKSLLNCYAGGISSYILIMMIVAYFKKHGESTYAVNLMEFLGFYGRSFNPIITGIAITSDENISPFFLLPDDGLIRNTLTMLDQVNIGRNIGGGSFNISIILSEFNKTMEKFEEVQLKIEETLRSARNKGVKIDDYDNLEDLEDLNAYTAMNLLESLLD
jgi:DNA polymerase sigma